MAEPASSNVTMPEAVDVSSAAKLSAIAQVMRGPASSYAASGESASQSAPGMNSSDPRDSKNFATGQALPPLSHPLRAQSLARSWTNEPVLMALLLVALLVLAVDSYFVVRLNGLSDRLNAVAARSTATVATSATDRPWVGTDNIRTADFSAGGRPVTVLHLVNSGRAPALDFRSNTVGRLSSASTPPPEIPGQPGPLATTGMMLPNAQGNLTFFDHTRALTPQEATSIKSGQYVLWLAGRLDYHDAQGRSHTTTFRYRYNPALGTFTATPAGNSVN